MKNFGRLDIKKKTSTIRCFVGIQLLLISCSFCGVSDAATFFLGNGKYHLTEKFHNNNCYYYKSNNNNPLLSFERRVNAVGNTKRIRIRTTQESDLPIVAKILSTASTRFQRTDGKNLNGLGYWKKTLDQLLAQRDIESLLRCRLEAIREGHKLYRRFRKLQQQQQGEPRDFLCWLWSTNDSLRNRIAKASADTGEDNLWRRHNFALTPRNISWLNHVQMTAVDVLTNQAVGFCEVAMLSNPILVPSEKRKTCWLEKYDKDNGDEQEEALDDDNDDYVVDEDEDGANDLAFSPAIMNLATGTEWRRRGIARNLLSFAERYVRLKWNYHQLGLYVEKNNSAAMALYQSMGYKIAASCDGGDQLGELWYMTKKIPRNGGRGRDAFVDSGESAFLSSSSAPVEAASDGLTTTEHIRL